MLIAQICCSSKGKSTGPFLNGQWELANIFVHGVYVTVGQGYRYTKKKHTLSTACSIHTYLEQQQSHCLGGLGGFTGWFNSSCSLSLLHVPTWDHGLLQNVAKVNPMCFQYPMILTEMIGPRSPNILENTKKTTVGATAILNDHNVNNYLTISQQLGFVSWNGVEPRTTTLAAEPFSGAQTHLGRQPRKSLEGLKFWVNQIYGPYNPNSG